MDDFMAKLAPAEDEPGLEQLSLEVARIAGQLALLAEREALQRTRRAMAEGEAPQVDRRFVRSLIRDRGRRSLWFAPDFRHPGWSIMLELFARRLEGRSIRISDLATVTGVAATTVLRWVDTLAGQNLVVRRESEGHARGVCVDISEDGARRMHLYLSAALGTLGAVG
jgi:DNA-binding MarR family transcriptional regulator